MFILIMILVVIGGVLSILVSVRVSQIDKSIPRIHLFRSDKIWGMIFQLKYPDLKYKRLVFAIRGVYLLALLLLGLYFAI